MSGDQATFGGLRPDSKLMSIFEVYKYSMNRKGRINNGGKQAAFVTDDARGPTSQRCTKIPTSSLDLVILVEALGQSATEEFDPEMLRLMLWHAEPERVDLYL